MKSKKESNEKTQIVEVTGNLEDTMTEEELKQFEEDFYLDGGLGYIPTWSSCYKPKEPKKMIMKRFKKQLFLLRRKKSLKELEKETMNGLNMMQMIYMNLMITPWRNQKQKWKNQEKNFLEIESAKNSRFFF